MTVVTQYGAVVAQKKENYDGGKIGYWDRIDGAQQ